MMYFANEYVTKMSPPLPLFHQKAKWKVGHCDQAGRDWKTVTKGRRAALHLHRAKMPNRVSNPNDLNDFSSVNHKKIFFPKIFFLAKQESEREAED